MINVSFLSGTRADYGKIKPYIEFLLTRSNVRVHIFITGMHQITAYGNTRDDIVRDFESSCHLVDDTGFAESSTTNQTAHIMSAFEQHLRADKIDFVFIHGDRSEAFGGAAAAAFNNIPVCHLEAGDLSGSIDESLRHAITKLSHRFFVCDEAARQVVLQLGENPDFVHITGNSSLACGNDVSPQKSVLPKSFKKYAVLIYHPVTTQKAETNAAEIKRVLTALEHQKINTVVIYPNNDLHSDVVRKAYKPYLKNKRFVFFTSLPFDVFKPILIGAQFLIGNSSCGIKEAPYYGVPVINVGRRQQHRVDHLESLSVVQAGSRTNLEKLIQQAIKSKSCSKKPYQFREAFFNRLESIITDQFWQVDLQKEMRLKK